MDKCIPGQFVVIFAEVFFCCCYCCLLLSFVVMCIVVFPRGRGEGNMLGHGNEENRPFPHLVQGLSRVEVRDIAIGKGCVFALTSGGVLYGWGSSLHGQLGVVAEAVPTPSIVPMVSSRSILAVYPGTSNVFCRLSSLATGQDCTTQKPFCVDVNKEVFVSLDKLLKRFTLDVDVSKPQPFQEEDNCLLLTTLSLLRLQVCVWYMLLWCIALGVYVIIKGCTSVPLAACVMFLSTQLHTAISEQVDPNKLDLTSGSALLSSLKDCLIELSCSAKGLCSAVQEAAQDTLRTCWRILMPTVEERAGTLTLFLQREGGMYVCVHQCLQPPRFIRVFPEMGLGKRITNTNWIITEIDKHLYGTENGYL